MGATLVSGSFLDQAISVRGHTHAGAYLAAGRCPSGAVPMPALISRSRDTSWSASSLLPPCTAVALCPDAGVELPCEPGRSWPVVLPPLERREAPGWTQSMMRCARR